MVSTHYPPFWATSICTAPIVIKYKVLPKLLQRLLTNLQKHAWEVKKMAKNVRVTRESGTGLNQEFHDPGRHKTMNRHEFVRAIGNGRYPGYHVAQIHGKNIPRSNPDRSTGNNLN